MIIPVFEEKMLVLQEYTVGTGVVRHMNHGKLEIAKVSNNCYFVMF